MKDTLKQSIIRFLEEKGEASKTQICDHIRELHGSTGDCVARRMRELVVSGIVGKSKKEYADKTYFSYWIRLTEKDFPMETGAGTLYLEPTKELKLNQTELL